MARHVICRVDELPPGSARRVDIEGREIALFNDGGTLAAIGNRCPHEGGELCRGMVRAFHTAEGAGEYVATDRRMVRCPWHGWEFDIRTGQSYVDPRRVRVKPFDVAVETGAGIAEGPYRVEVFQVEAEAEYVVLTI